jgi:BirA family transcriptional regulator, biotin operon repressor / biotin---[acetyl-CoA-carboxylase] ligase
MDKSTLRKVLADIPLGGMRVFDSIGSSNDAAMAWAAQGAPDLALVYAEEQTAGRGRSGRSWFTQPGSSLAFSLVMRPQGQDQSITLFSGLGAVAVCEAFCSRGLKPQIKWPNDVLLAERKVCGVLVETVWLGNEVDSIILGVGVNVGIDSTPIDEKLNFPATSLEAVTGSRVGRPELLAEILHAILAWRSLLTTDGFHAAWESRLAFRGEKVGISTSGGEQSVGSIDGLEPDGSLRLLLESGQKIAVHAGEVILRPVL